MGTSDATTATATARADPPHHAELDWLRGLACAAVVAFHYGYRGQQDAWIADAAPRWLAMPLRYGYLGVHLFFIVSGFVIFMTASGATPRAFVASRVARLFPAYWAAVLLTGSVCRWAGGADFAVSDADLLVNLTMLTHLVALHWDVSFVDGAYWSLGVECQFYLLVWLGLCLGVLEAGEWLVAGWLLLSALALVRPMFNLGVWLALEWAPLFSAGVLFFLVHRQGLTVRRYLLLWAAYVLAVAQAIRPAVLSIAAPGDPPRDPWAVFMVLSVAFGVFALLALHRLRLPAYRWVRWAGLLTYPVYLLHQNLGYVLLARLRPVWPSFGGRLALCVGLVIGVALLVHQWVERPLGRWLKGWMQAPARCLDTVVLHQPSR